MRRQEKGRGDGKRGPFLIGPQNNTGAPRRWRNIDTRNTVKLEFMLDIPWALRGEGLHFKDVNDKSHDRWPASERRIRIHVAPGAECTLPEIWSSAILTVHDGVIRGGMAPAQMRPVGVPPAELD